jgi:hypothetical protein
MLLGCCTYQQLQSKSYSNSGLAVQPKRLIASSQNELLNDGYVFGQSQGTTPAV